MNWARLNLMENTLDEHTLVNIFIRLVALKEVSAQ